MMSVGGMVHVGLIAARSHSCNTPFYNTSNSSGHIFKYLGVVVTAQVQDCGEKFGLAHFKQLGKTWSTLTLTVIG